jgi:hypothetical protein
VNLGAVAASDEDEAEAEEEEGGELLVDEEEVVVVLVGVCIPFPFLSFPHPSISTSDKLTFDSFFEVFQVEEEDAVALVVDLVEVGAVPLVVGEPAVVVAEAVVEGEGGATPCWSRIDTLGCSSPRGRTICW